MIIEMSTFHRRERESSPSGDESLLTAVQQQEDIPLLRGGSNTSSTSATSLRYRGEVALNELADDTHYDDFHTIDWVRDRNKERFRQKALQRGVRSGGIAARIWKHVDASSGWLVVLLVGMATGFAAGVIDIGTIWMSDLKEGVCIDNFYYSKEACCFQSNETSYDVEHCSEWRTWSQLFLHAEEGQHAYIFNYFFYVFISVIFGTLCVWLVRTFAPYACGSGIPEVCGRFGCACMYFDLEMTTKWCNQGWTSCQNIQWYTFMHK